MAEVLNSYFFVFFDMEILKGWKKMDNGLVKDPEFDAKGFEI